MIKYKEIDPEVLEVLEIKKSLNILSSTIRPIENLIYEKDYQKKYWFSWWKKLDFCWQMVSFFFMLFVFFGITLFYFSWLDSNVGSFWNWFISYYKSGFVFKFHLVFISFLSSFVLSIFMCATFDMLAFLTVKRDYIRVLTTSISNKIYRELDRKGISANEFHVPKLTHTQNRKQILYFIQQPEYFSYQKLVDEALPHLEDEYMHFYLINYFKKTQLIVPIDLLPSFTDYLHHLVSSFYFNNFRESHYYMICMLYIIEYYGINNYDNVFIGYEEHLYDQFKPVNFYHDLKKKVVKSVGESEEKSEHISHIDNELSNSVNNQTIKPIKKKINKI